MRFLDFFSGIGGFRLGMEQAGHECVGHCEIDKYANISYAAIHKPKESEFFATDIRGIIPVDLPDADCYCGGFPCQSFSIAGKRGGFEDTRGTLFFEVMRLARERQPKLLFLENVKGLLSHDGGKTFGTILSALWECGYDAQWQVLNSKDYVPQNRERIFIIANLRTGSRPEVFPIRNDDETTIDIQGQQNVCNTITARYEGAQATGTYVVEREQYAQGNQLNDPSHSNDRVYGTDGISPTLNKIQGGLRQPFILSPKRTEYGKEVRKQYENGDRKESRHNMTSLEPREDGISNTISTVQKDNLLCVPVLTPDRPEKRQNGRRFKDNGEEMFTLTAQDRHGVMIKSLNPRTDGKQTYQQDRVYEESGLLPALNAQIGGRNNIKSNAQIRRLTPLECWRLQGFPDWTHERAVQAGVSDSQRYKQAGNSVTVNVIYEIARRLK